MDLSALECFYNTNRIGRKGTLCVGLTVTRWAVEHGLPVVFDDLLTPNQGQVAVLGKANVQKILNDHGIRRVLAEEGGRTNRGNVGLTGKYVAFLNDANFSKEELQEIEAWWVARVKDFFTAKPLTFKLDPSVSLRAAIRSLLAMVEQRQSEDTGSTIVGTVMQHLVGAKLIVLLGDSVEIHGASVSDSVSEREGDFFIGDVIVHVTTAPTEALIRKCSRNLDGGKHPIIVTRYKTVPLAEGLAEQRNIADRIDVFDIEQFLASNLYELGQFDPQGRKSSVKQLIGAYNQIVEKCETDPSLIIKITPDK